MFVTSKYIEQLDVPRGNTDKNGPATPLTPPWNKKMPGFKCPAAAENS